MFTCCCCMEEKPVSRKMPSSSLGCDCTIEMCVDCFLRDFEQRAAPHWVNDVGVSKWESEDELEDHLVEQFMESEDYTEDTFEDLLKAFLLKHFYWGKPCPVCNTMVLWSTQEVPRVLASTGRLTFFAPSKRCTGIRPTQ